MHLIPDHPALAELPPNLLICPSTEGLLGCPGCR